MPIWILARRETLMRRVVDGRDGVATRIARRYDRNAVRTVEQPRGRGVGARTAAGGVIPTWQSGAAPPTGTANVAESRRAVTRCHRYRLSGRCAGPGVPRTRNAPWRARLERHHAAARRR